MVYEGLCGEISIFMTGQTTDGQNRLLNPASRMRARGNYDCAITALLVHSTEKDGTEVESISSSSGKLDMIDD